MKNHTSGIGRYVMHLGWSNLGEKREPNWNPFELILFQNKLKKRCFDTYFLGSMGGFICPKMEVKNIAFHLTTGLNSPEEDSTAKMDKGEFSLIFSWFLTGIWRWRSPSAAVLFKSFRESRQFQKQRQMGLESQLPWLLDML
jgi:hypothetical protein